MKIRRIVAGLAVSGMVVAGSAAGAAASSFAPTSPVVAAQSDAPTYATSIALTVQLENKENEVVERNVKGATWNLYSLNETDNQLTLVRSITQKDHDESDPFASSVGIQYNTALPAGTYVLEFVGISNDALPNEYHLARLSENTFTVTSSGAMVVSNVTLREGKAPSFNPDDDWSGYFTPSYSSDPKGSEFTVAAGSTLTVQPPKNVLGDMDLPEGMRYQVSPQSSQPFVTVGQDGSLTISPDEFQTPGTYDMIVWALYRDGSWDQIYNRIVVTEPSKEPAPSPQPLPQVTGTATVVQADAEGLIVNTALHGLVAYDYPNGYYVGLIERGTELNDGLIPAGAQWVRTVTSESHEVATNLITPDKLDRTKQYSILVWRAHSTPSAENNRAVIDVDVTGAQWDSIFGATSTLAEPSPGATEQPTPEVTEQPSPGATEQPTPEETVSPAPDKPAEPAPHAPAVPTPSESPAPEQGASEKPSTGDTGAAATKQNEAAQTRVTDEQTPAKPKVARAKKLAYTGASVGLLGVAALAVGGAGIVAVRRSRDGL
ncbi:hypothetical protein I6E29_05435 [Arcanobacterium haemolyticum]|nr:hypothetical protein [Arcanobacterium haemolyticum]